MKKEKTKHELLCKIWKEYWKEISPIDYKRDKKLEEIEERFRCKCKTCGKEINSHVETKGQVLRKSSRNNNSL